MPELAESLTSDAIDKLILEQGMSLGNSDAYDFLSCDQETAMTIREIEEQLNEMMESGDYSRLDQTKTDLAVLKSDLGPRIAQLQGQILDSLSM